MSENTSPTFHDLHVKERLPRWLEHLTPTQLARLKHLEDYANCTWANSASPELRLALAEAQQRNREVTFALARATADLRSIPEFSGPLLMQQLGLGGLELKNLKFVRFTRDWNWKALATDLNHRVEPLLQAALQNFEKDAEMQPESAAISGDFKVGSFNGYARYSFDALPFSAAQFAAQCHELDLGQRYQQHLEQVLNREEVRSLGIRARREALQLELIVARMRGLEGDHAQVQRLIDGASDAPRCQHFSLFGVDVLDALLIRPAHSEALFLYLPGMPRALSHYPSLAACQRAVLRQLCDPALRQRFYTFIQQDKLEHFASVLQRNLTGQTLASDRDRLWSAAADTNLHWVSKRIEDDLFPFLQDRHYRRLRNEARLLAVPSADADEAARQRRLHYWESVGLDVLGVAAFFIPAAGSLMMLVFAAQVLDEIYEGVEAWEQGDIDGALEHAKAVAIDIGTAVATGVTLHYAGRLRSKLVEILRPDGTPRLWNGDLRPYRVDPPAAAQRNELGLLHSAGEHYLQLDDGHYRVQPHADGQRWQIRHPHNARAAQPLLEHNGDGAWHAAHERPLEWPQATLLRRLGARVAQYSDDELDIACRISDTTRDELLDVYLKHSPTPPRLLATLQRLRAGLPAQDPLEAVLEGLYHPARCLPASERLALLSLPEQPGWPADCSLELRAGDRSGPLLERAGERFAGDVRLIIKGPDGYFCEPGGPVQADLFDAIVKAFPELSSTARALKNRIVERALLQPARTRSWIWSGHSAGWRDEGRLLGGFDAAPRTFHYPSFRPPVDPLRARYCRLYPASSDEQAGNALRAWSDAGKQPHLELRALEQQLDYLRTTLGQWASAAPRRTVARDTLIRSWQRNQLDQRELNLTSVGLTDEDLATLPHLAGAFGHVEELHLSGNPLRSMPYLLTRQLPAMRTLFASAMELEALPGGLPPTLRSLELTDNNIVWSPASQDALASYPALERLNLSGNPLTVTPYLPAAPSLIEANLFDCSLYEMPMHLERLPNLEHLDLSSNHISVLPPGLEQQLSADARRALSLEHNPLDEDALNRIDNHYQATGIDLLVAEDDYTSLLLDADDSTQACWERLARLLPVEYRRDLRGVADEPAYQAAPITTRRRFWFMLHWLEGSPLARAAAQRIDASKLLHYELLADLQQPEPFATQRQRTEHYLNVAVAAARSLAVDQALLARLPGLGAEPMEALRALTLQRLGSDPQLQLRIAPTAREPVNLDGVQQQAQQLDGLWTSALRHQLRLIDGTTAIGRDAILAEQPNGEPALPFWKRHLEQRYHVQFEQLQEQANAQLLDAENLLSEGEYLNEANHLRRQLERERQRLLDDLTRSIAEGSQTHW